MDPTVVNNLDLVGNMLKLWTNGPFKDLAMKFMAMFILINVMSEIAIPYLMAYIKRNKYPGAEETTSYWRDKDR